MPPNRKRIHGPRRIRTKRGYRYLDARGRHINYATYLSYKTLAEQAKAESPKPQGAKKHWKKSRQRLFSTLGEHVPNRRGPKAEKHSNRAAELIARGILPKPDALNDAVNPFNTRQAVRNTYWRFEGIEHENTVKDLLLILQERHEVDGVLAHASVGTGFGKTSQWVSSRIMPPIKVKDWMERWANSASGQDILEAHNEGSAIWFEVYSSELVMGVSNGKSKRMGPKQRGRAGAEGAKRGKHSKRGKTPARNAKASVKGAKGNRKKPANAPTPRAKQGKRRR